MSSLPSESTAEAPSPQHLLRFSLYIKRRVDITEREFNDHWSNVHAPLVKEWLMRHGIVRYAQVSSQSLLVSSYIDSRRGSSVFPFLFLYHGKVDKIQRRVITVLLYTKADAGQYHTPPSLQTSSIDTFPNLTASPYDGVVELVVRDVADFVRATQDPFYKEHVIPDEEAFLQRGNAAWVVGWEEVKFDLGGQNKGGVGKA